MNPLVELELSKYYAWSERSTYDLFKCPGVYAINISDKDDLAGQTLNWDDIDYIGRSVDSLKTRLNKFNYAIQHGIRHSAGNKIFKRYENDATWRETHKLYIYVAMMGIECGNYDTPLDFYRIRGIASYLEFEAFAQCFEVTGKLPQYNKTKLPKRKK